MLTESDRIFIKKRARFAAAWNPVAILILIALGLTLFWMYLKSPYLVNPTFVAEAIQNNRMDEILLATSALILPVVVLFVFLVLAVFVLIGFSVFTNEKRYLTIIENLSK